MRGISHPALDRELAVVAALRDAGTTVGPNQAERDRMRRRLMAEFPAIVHEGSSPVLPLRRSKLRRAVPDETRGRLVVAAAAALCLLMSLSGMSVLLSRDAVPGDALYTFKRSAESAELGLTFGQEGKALKHLEFASQRVNELEVMADKSNADWATGGDGFVRALSDFEQDTTAGSRLLTEVAASGQGGILPALRGWVEQQETRLQALHAALPLPASTRLDSTLVLLDRVVDRIAALERRSDCDAVTSGAHDDLGLLPATGSCEAPVPPSGTSSASPLPTSDAPSQTPPPPGGIVPPGLVAPPSGDTTPDTSEDGKLRLPDSPDDVLPTPDKTGDAPPSLPGDGSGRPFLPVPLPNLPLLPLLPLDDPHFR
jgi:hypothetical protein